MVRGHELLSRECDESPVVEVYALSQDQLHHYLKTRYLLSSFRFKTLLVNPSLLFLSKHLSDRYISLSPYRLQHYLKTRALSLVFFRFRIFGTGFGW